MIKYLLHDMLGDVTVYQGGSQRVTPLVGSEVRGPTMLIADIAALQPAVERWPVGAAGDRDLAVRVLLRPGKQHGPGRVAVQDPLLLAADQLQQLVIDGDESLAFHLVVEVAKIGGSAVVGDRAAERQPEGVGDAQAAADQDDRG